jgi:hypothetical protein
MFLYTIFLLLQITRFSQAYKARWYVNWNLVDQNVLFAKTHTGSLLGFYPCCNKFTVSAEGFFLPEHNDSDVKAALNPYSELGLDVLPTLELDENYLFNFSGLPGGFDLVINNATDNAVRNNFDGYMVDYEPSLQNTTMAHSIAYANFLGQFAKSLHSKGKKLGMDLSNWGILNKYSLYSKLDLDIFTSMSTYYGTNLTDNMNIVKQMTSVIDTDKLAIGIGTMATNADFHYNWTEYKLDIFLYFLQDNNITEIDIWRSDIDNTEQTGTTLPWFLRMVDNWVNQSCTP